LIKWVIGLMVPNGDLLTKIVFPIYKYWIDIGGKIDNLPLSLSDYCHVRAEKK